MMDDLVTKARSLLAAASPGPWHVNSRPWMGLEFGVLDSKMRVLAHVREVGPEMDRTNAALMAGAPELLVALADRVELLTERGRHMAVLAAADATLFQARALVVEGQARRIAELEKELREFKEAEEMAGKLDGFGR